MISTLPTSSSLALQCGSPFPHHDLECFCQLLWELAHEEEWSHVRDIVKCLCEVRECLDSPLLQCCFAVRSLSFVPSMPFSLLVASHRGASLLLCSQRSALSASSEIEVTNSNCWQTGGWSVIRFVFHFSLLVDESSFLSS